VVADWSLWLVSFYLRGSKWLQIGVCGWIGCYWIGLVWLELELGYRLELVIVS
jgi:hypothetical protein